jgi:hypothetical protein
MGVPDQNFLNECSWFNKIFSRFLLRKVRLKFLLAFVKNLTDFKKPIKNCLQIAFCNIQKAAGDSKNVLKADYAKKCDVMYSTQQKNRPIT